MNKGAAVQVLSGELERGEEEEEKEEEEEEKEKEDEEEGEEAGVRKKRRVREEEERMASDVRTAIEELSLGCADEKCVSTSAFLTVSNLLLLALDKVVPNMFVLRQDVQRNIERLENLYALKPSAYSNLLEMLRKEADEEKAKKPDSCSRSVVWLTRSMNFGLNLMERLIKNSDLSVEEAVEEAYSANFRHCHGWISSAAYKVALKLVPDREDFTELLTGRGGQDQCLLTNDMLVLISLLQPFLTEVHSHLKAFRLDRCKSS